MINNRQNGRRRGRGGQRSQGGGNQGSRDNGNRIDSRARGNASQLYEKYKNMASDAQRQGDRVNTEYYLQFADHYFRVLADQRGRYEDQAQPQRRSQNDFDMDEDFGDEGDPIRADEQGRGGEDRGDRDGRQHDGNRARGDRDDDQRGEGYRGDGQRGEGQRRDSYRGDGQRGDQRQRDGQERRPRRGEQRREERAAAPHDVEQASEQAIPAELIQPLVGSPSAAPVADVQADGEALPAPKRRGRPRKVPAEAGEQLGFDPSALPPSIGGDAPADDAAPKPRRRRTIATPVEADA